mgnify:CR=1 FL=1
MNNTKTNQTTEAQALARITARLPKWIWDAHSPHAKRVIIGWELRAMKNLPRTTEARTWEAATGPRNSPQLRNVLNERFWERAELNNKTK